MNFNFVYSLVGVGVMGSQIWKMVWSCALTEIDELFLSPLISSSIDFEMKPCVMKHIHEYDGIHGYTDL